MYIAVRGIIHYKRMDDWKRKLKLQVKETNPYLEELCSREHSRVAFKLQLIRFYLFRVITVRQIII